MITVKDLLTSTIQRSPDGKHWEPALPTPHWLLRTRFMDAWEVLMGRATAIRNTRKNDLEGMTNDYKTKLY